MCCTTISIIYLLRYWKYYHIWALVADISVAIYAYFQTKKQLEDKGSRSILKRALLGMYLFPVVYVFLVSPIHGALIHSYMNWHNPQNYVGHVILRVSQDEYRLSSIWISIFPNLAELVCVFYAYNRKPTSPAVSNEVKQD